MTEKEKSKLGLLYDGNYNEELNAERLHCKNLCHKYNSILPTKIAKRKKIIKKIIGKTGKNFWIEQSFQCDYGYNISIGENFYSNHNLVILDTAKVEFGHDCFIAPNCGFYAAGHPIDYPQRNLGLEIAFPIKVGNNVWIGGNVVVLPGVTIGNNSIIAAGSVVNKDIPDNVIAGGVPCKIIRKITEQDKYKYNSPSLKKY